MRRRLLLGVMAAVALSVGGVGPGLVSARPWLDDPVPVRGGAAAASSDAVHRLTAADVPLPAADPDPWADAGHLRRWRGEPGWIAGRSVYDQGEYIHTDFLYDDTGAGTRAQYPRNWDTYLDNAADIAEVRIAREADATLLRITTNAMAIPDAAVLGIGLGHEEDPGGGDWPLGAGVTVPSGIATVITTWGSRVVVHDVATGDRIDDPGGASAVVDVDANTVELRLPDRLFDPRDRFSAVVLSGLWDHAGDVWMPITAPMPSHDQAGGGNSGDPAVFNVAFRAEEDPYARSNEQVRANDAVQAAALAADDLSPFVTVVDRGKLDARIRDSLDLDELHGTFIRTYRSRADLGEGILDVAGVPCWESESESSDIWGCVAAWRGRFVPYLVDVPESYDGSPAGLIHTSHGAGDNHTQNEINVERTQPFRDELGTILVGNSGRGKGSWYQRHGELDQLEVLADVTRHYAVAADHVIKLGESMGGIGTYIFGMRTPGLARAIVPLDGVAFYNDEPTISAGIGGLYTGESYVFESLVPNLTNTPVHAEAAFADPLVPWNVAYDAHVLPLEDLGGRVDHYVCQGTHTTQWTQSDRWLRFLEDQLRAPPPPVPSRIRYATDPLQQSLSREYGLEERRAWWVRDIRPATDDPSFLDLRTATLRSTEPVDLVDGDDIVPTHPDDGGLGPCTRTAQLWEGTQDHVVANRVTGLLRGIDSLTLDLVDMDVAPGPITLELDSDGLVSLRLAPLAGGVLRVDGGTATSAVQDNGHVTVPVRPGKHVYELQPRWVTRHQGPTRIETAVAVSSLGVESAETVAIARADLYADALAGTPLAVHLDAPVLVSAWDGLSTSTAEEIRRLGASEAVLLGGEAALSPHVAADLEGLGLSVRRVAGTNRFATAAAIAAELPYASQVLVARGDGFADASTASGLASATGRPVLLVEPGRLPAETASALEAAERVTIVGGAAAVSEAVAAAIDGVAGTVSRLAGETRYETSRAVADAAIAAGVAPSIMWVATGRDFPDALVAGAAAGREAGVLLLVDGADPNGSPETSDWLARHAETVDAVRLAGGTAAVIAEVEAALQRLR